MLSNKLTLIKCVPWIFIGKGVSNSSFKWLVKLSVNKDSHGVLTVLLVDYLKAFSFAFKWQAHQHIVLPA